MRLVILGAGKLLIHILKNVDFSVYKLINIFVSDVQRNKDIVYLRENNFPVDTEKIETSRFKSIIKNLQPDVILCIGVREIISKETISIPTIGIVNLHGALLPYQRGAGGDYGGVINDKILGLSTHFMDEGIDSGPIIYSDYFKIKNGDSKEEMIAKSFDITPRIIKKSLELILDESFKPKTQEKYCYYPRKPDWDEYIDWTETSQLLYDKIRARNPGCLNFTIHNGEILFIFKAEMVDFIKSYIAPCGQVIGNIKNKGVLVKTGDTALLLTEVAYGDISLTINRSKYPYDIPENIFVPKFRISSMLGVNIYKEYFSLLDRVTILEQKIDKINKE